MNREIKEKEAFLRNHLNNIKEGVMLFGPNIMGTLLVGEYEFINAVINGKIDPLTAAKCYQKVLNVVCPDDRGVGLYNTMLDCAEGLNMSNPDITERVEKIIEKAEKSVDNSE